VVQPRVASANALHEAFSALNNPKWNSLLQRLCSSRGWLFKNIIDWLAQIVQTPGQVAVLRRSANASHWQDCRDRQREICPFRGGATKGHGLTSRALSKQ